MARKMQRGVRLTFTEQERILELVQAGRSYAKAAATVGCCERTVQRLMRRIAAPAQKPRHRSPLRLSLAEREEISRGLRSGESQRSIACRLARCPSTICREIAANGGRERYRAWKADLRALACARRPKRAKLAARPRLRREVERLLALCWSPQQIAARLRLDHPNESEM